MYQLFRYCLVIGLLSALAAATTHASSEPLPNYDVLGECFTALDLDPDHESGYVTVPEFHDGRTDRALRLAVVRIFATDEDKAGAPIFFVDGGPGASMKGLLSVNIGNIKLNQTSPGDAGTPLLDMLAGHDFVMLSQRGAEFSEPAVLTCPEGEDSDLMGVLNVGRPDTKAD